METTGPAAGYTCEELLEIYRRAGSVELEALYRAAEELYPGRRMQTPPAKILVEEGPHGRWFRREGQPERYEQPKYTIKSQPLNWIGVMEDGAAYIY